MGGVAGGVVVEAVVLGLQVSLAAMEMIFLQAAANEEFEDEDEEEEYIILDVGTQTAMDPPPSTLSPPASTRDTPIDQSPQPTPFALLTAAVSSALSIPTNDEQAEPSHPIPHHVHQYPPPTHEPFDAGRLIQTLALQTRLLAQYKYMVKAMIDHTPYHIHRWIKEDIRFLEREVYSSLAALRLLISKPPPSVSPHIQVAPPPTDASPKLTSTQPTKHVLEDDPELTQDEQEICDATSGRNAPRHAKRATQTELTSTHSTKYVLKEDPDLTQDEQDTTPGRGAPRHAKRSKSYHETSPFLLELLSHPIKTSYGDTTVWEMSIGELKVLRRVEEGMVNITQVLRLAGANPKMKLSGILGGCESLRVVGKESLMRGTWIPAEKALQIAREYGVAKVLKPLFACQVGAAGGSGQKKFSHLKIGQYCLSNISVRQTMSTQNGTMPPQQISISPSDTTAGASKKKVKIVRPCLIASLNPVTQQVGLLHTATFGGDPVPRRWRELYLAITPNHKSGQVSVDTEPFWGKERAWQNVWPVILVDLSRVVRLLKYEGASDTDVPNEYDEPGGSEPREDIEATRALAGSALGNSIDEVSVLPAKAAREKPPNPLFSALEEAKENESSMFRIYDTTRGGPSSRPTKLSSFPRSQSHIFLPEHCEAHAYLCHSWVQDRLIKEICATLESHTLLVHDAESAEPNRTNAIDSSAIFVCCLSREFE
ncbi:transcriptional regulator swi6, partial [Podochytrium sp. JEL0797]